jgi:hypothetical protein
MIGRGGVLAFAPSMVRQPSSRAVVPANQSTKVLSHLRLRDSFEGRSDMSGLAVMENVRRYRAIASMYRQTAAFRPSQSWSLLAQAREWEYLALRELEAHFTG